MREDIDAAGTPVPALGLQPVLEAGRTRHRESLGELTGRERRGAGPVLPGHRAVEVVHVEGELLAQSHLVGQGLYREITAGAAQVAKGLVERVACLRPPRCRPREGR